MYCMYIPYVRSMCTVLVHNFGLVHCNRRTPGEDQGGGGFMYAREVLFSAMKPATLRPYLPTSALRRRRPTFVARNYAVQAPGRPTLEVFNQKVKLLQKERAASNVDESRKVDYLRDEVAQRLTDRLLDINRQFPHVLDLGANSCNIARALSNPQ